MSDTVNSYSISIMTGCLAGKVPQIPDIYEIIRGRRAVKLILLDDSVIYGFIDSFNRDRNTINFTMPVADGKTSRQLYALSLYAANIYLASPLDETIPASTGSTIIIAGELFTVVDTNYGISIWVGDSNLIYYPEDIQALIYKNGVTVLK